MYMDLGSLRKIIFRRRPEYIRFFYKGYIRWCKDLKNGWHLVVLKNKLTLLCSEIHKMEISFVGFKRYFVSKDGKMMITTRNDGNVIISSQGETLVPFDKQNKLYWNGWYRVKTDDGFELYDENGNCIGNKLKATKVFRTGQYFMSITPQSDTSAGFYDANGNRLIFSNATSYKVLPNSWFVVNNDLYDNLGDLFIEEMYGRRIPTLLLCIAGLLMKKRS